MGWACGFRDDGAWSAADDWSVRFEVKPAPRAAASSASATAVRGFSPSATTSTTPELTTLEVVMNIFESAGALGFLTGFGLNAVRTVVGALALVIRDEVKGMLK